MALTAGEEHRSDGAARVDALERAVTSLRSAAQGVPAAGGAAGAAAGGGAAGLRADRAEKDTEALRGQVRSLEEQLKALRLAPNDGKGAAPTPRQAEETERAGLESAALKEQVHFHLTECIN